MLTLENISPTQGDNETDAAFKVRTQTDFGYCVHIGVVSSNGHRCLRITDETLKTKLRKKYHKKQKGCFVSVFILNTKKSGILLSFRSESGAETARVEISVKDFLSLVQARTKHLEKYKCRVVDPATVNLNYKDIMKRCKKNASA